MDIRRHPRDRRLPALKEHTLLYLASLLARLDAFHHGQTACWIALLECSHDESMGRGFVIPVAPWVALPNVAGRYLAKLVGRTETGAERVEVSYRCCPDHRRVIRVVLEVDGDGVDERGIQARAFHSRGEAETHLRVLQEIREEGDLADAG